VTSNLGADGGGTFSRLNGVASYGSYTINYSGAQVYSAIDPSVCEVFFVLNLNPVSLHALLSEG